MSFWENARRPSGLGGKLMLSMMNWGHRALAAWGLSFLEIPDGASVLDCGCGGGANMQVILKNCPQSTVKGLDASQVSVEKARKVNERAIQAGRCAVLQGDAADMLFASGWFDVVTAFETVYFWPDLPRCFREVYRVLKPQGTFFICNECGGDSEKDEKWAERIDGMTVCQDALLRTALEQAGFGSVESHRNEKGWLCILARK